MWEKERSIDHAYNSTSSLGKKMLRHVKRMLNRKGSFYFKQTTITFSFYTLTFLSIVYLFICKILCHTFSLLCCILIYSVAAYTKIFGVSVSVSFIETNQTFCNKWIAFFPNVVILSSSFLSLIFCCLGEWSNKIEIV